MLVLTSSVTVTQVCTSMVTHFSSSRSVQVSWGTVAGTSWHSCVEMVVHASTELVTHSWVGIVTHLKRNLIISKIRGEGYMQIPTSNILCYAISFE